MNAAMLCCQCYASNRQSNSLMLFVLPCRPISRKRPHRSLEMFFFSAVACDTVPWMAQLNVLAFTGYGGDVIKTFKISPDAFVQMALQLAVFKMTGKCHVVVQ